jgi:transcription elongation factor Elf1
VCEDPGVTTPAPFRFDVVKEYPQRGPLQQYRTKNPTAFVCFRCGSAKTSKLVALISGIEGQTICNGCYGHLASVWDIRRGDAEDSVRDDMIVSALSVAVTQSTIEQSRALLLAREGRAYLLSPEAQMTLATA